MQIQSALPIVLETQSKVLLRHNSRAALAFGVGMAAAGVAAMVLIPGAPKLSSAPSSACSSRSCS